MNNVTILCAFVSVILISMSVLAFVHHQVIQDTFGNKIHLVTLLKNNIV
jgi:hypothetical protein